MPSPDPVPACGQIAKRLRLAGIIVLLLGVVAAGIIWGLGTRVPDSSGDLSMQKFDRARRIQMGQLFGGMGGLIQDSSDAVKQPGVQAGLILAAAVILAAGCFFFAHRIAAHQRAAEMTKPEGQMTKE